MVDRNTREELERARDDKVVLVHAYDARVRVEAGDDGVDQAIDGV